MSYVSLNLTDETVKKIKAKQAELENELIDDELITEIFMNERKNLVRQIVNNAMQSSDAKKTISGVINEQLDCLIHGLKTDLEQVRITTTELGIKIGQIWMLKSSPENEVIITKTTQNAVRYAYFNEDSNITEHSFVSVSDFIHNFIYTTTYLLEKGTMWFACEDAPYPFKEPHDEVTVKIHSVKKNVIVIEPDEIYDDEYNESNLDLGEIPFDEFFEYYLIEKDTDEN